VGVLNVRWVKLWRSDASMVSLSAMAVSLLMTSSASVKLTRLREPSCEFIRDKFGVGSVVAIR
jgi:hypothetical protein